MHQQRARENDVVTPDVERMNANALRAILVHPGA
jgi:hypothetical protein